MSLDPLVIREIREIEDAIANNVIPMAYLWDKHARGECNITQDFISDIFQHAACMMGVLNKYHTSDCFEESERVMIISPTGLNVRESDEWGSGLYGAPRGKGKTHDGLDFICKPGQSIYSPISGIFTRIANPYSDDTRFSGVEIKNDALTLLMFYLTPNQGWVGTEIKQGEILGSAQDISMKYPGITPHVHIRVTSIDPMILLSKGEAS